MTNSKIKYSRLNNVEDTQIVSCSTYVRRGLSWNKILGGISCCLFSVCIILGIILAKIFEENSFLSSDYTNYTGSYSFGVVSDIQLDLNDSSCCRYTTEFSCLCCPNKPKLINATFKSFVAVLKMYVNTKFILYLGNIAHNSADTVTTYSYFRFGLELINF